MLTLTGESEMMEQSYVDILDLVLVLGLGSSDSFLTTHTVLLRLAILSERLNNLEDVASERGKQDLTVK